jgi:hypothetical protein
MSSLKELVRCAAMPRSRNAGLVAIKSRFRHLHIGAAPTTLGGCNQRRYIES